MGEPSHGTEYTVAFEIACLYWANVEGSSEQVPTSGRYEKIPDLTQLLKLNNGEIVTLVDSQITGARKASKPAIVREVIKGGSVDEWKSSRYVLLGERKNDDEEQRSLLRMTRGLFPLEVAYLFFSQSNKNAKWCYLIEESFALVVTNKRHPWSIPTLQVDDDRYEELKKNVDWEVRHNCRGLKCPYCNGTK